MSLKKLSLKSSLTALTGLLLADKACQAMPAPPVSSLTNIAARAEVSPPGLYGDSGIPEIGDVVMAQNLVTPMGVEYDEGMQRYTNILSAFVKCSPAWVQSWLVNAEERDAMEPVANGGSYFLRHDDEGDKRQAVAVTPSWVDTYVGTGERDILKAFSGPWWPWALLQGALDGGSDAYGGELDFPAIVKALSGETLEVSNPKSDQEIWDIVSKADYTPVWIRFEGSGVLGRWQTVMTARGTGPDDGFVSIGSVMPDRFEHYPESEFKNAINLQVVREIDYLKGFPSFDGKRKGDFEPPVRP